MPSFIDLTGKKFGRWTVECRGENKDIYARWVVVCDCGNRGLVKGQSLRDGISRSCGCFNRDVHRETCIKRNTTHSLSRTKAFNTWVNIRQRCNNPRIKIYERYGAKGVRVCDRWSTFENFFADMGHPPTDRHTIDRIDNSLGYSPGNCRWATMKEQQNNRTNNHMVSLKGEIMTLMQMSEKLGINRKTLARHIAKGIL